MTAERHNAPQHNLYANQAGNAGDGKSSAHSSLPWRWLGRFFATTVLASFVLKEIWEMAQVSAYVETEGHSWTSTLDLGMRAVVGRSQRSERLFMMNQTGGWMDGRAEECESGRWSASWWWSCWSS